MRDLTNADYSSYIHSHPAYYAIESFCTISPNDYYFSLLDIPQYKIHHYANNKKPWTYISFWNEVQRDSGWKIHISATLNNHTEILKKVAIYAFTNQIAFKFAINEGEFIRINSKTINRASSGKFIVLYPTPSKFRTVIDDLYSLLKDYEGPYILSDNQYKDSRVVFYRYGEFIPVRLTDSYGTITTRILDAKNQLVVDKRNPYYSLPDWVEEQFPIPENQDNSILLSKYKISDAITFSAQGGVYVSEWNSKKCIIKEARAFSSIDSNKKYGTERLYNEFEILAELEKYSISPRPIELLEDHGNVYLVEEYLNGFTLRSYPHENSPLIVKIKDETMHLQKCKLFYTELGKIMHLTLSAMQLIHSLGIVVGDVSPSNILYDREEEKVHLIDLEVAEHIANIDANYKCGLYTPGFSADEVDLSPVQIDMHKLGLVFLHCIMPYDGLFELCPDKAFELLEIYQKNNTVPTSIISIINDLLSDQYSCIDDVLKHSSVNHVTPSIYSYKIPKTDINKVVTEIHNNIVAFLENRSHPIGNDPMGALTNAYSFGYGIFGMLYGINSMSIDINQNTEYVYDALVRTFMYDFYENSAKYQAGLYVGLSGIAYSLSEIGYDFEAQIIMEHAAKMECPVYDYAYGKAGRIVVLLYFYQKFGHEKYLKWAIDDAHLIMNDYKLNDSGIYWTDEEQDGYSGLTRGGAGIALALLLMYKATMNSEYLKFGIQALDSELNRLDALESGFIGINGYPFGSRTIVYSPYAHNGLSGLGSVIIRYYLETKEKKYIEIINNVIDSVRYKFLLHTGYLTGISGVLSYNGPHVKTTEEELIVNTF